MEFRVLRYFLTVANEENITRASQILNVTQPTLSRQMMQLEDELGVALFNRESHKTSLTDEGRLLKRHAEEILQLCQKAEREVSSNKSEISGVIGIGCGETKNMRILADWMTEFQKEFPKVTFQIFTGIADDVKDRIENGLLDMGLLMEPVEISRYNFVRMPIVEKWCLLCLKSSEIAKKSVVKPEDLLEEHLIFATRASVKNEIQNWFGENYSRLKIVGERNVSYSNCVQIVESGMGSAFVHEFECSNPNLCQVPLEPAILNGNVLVWKKEQVQSVALKKFVEFIKSKLNKGN